MFLKSKLSKIESFLLCESGAYCSRVRIGIDRWKKRQLFVMQIVGSLVRKWEKKSLDGVLGGAA